jgi:regulator of replication initiation timing
MPLYWLTPEDERTELHRSLRRIVSDLQHEIDELLEEKAAILRRTRHLRHQLREKRSELEGQLLADSMGRRRSVGQHDSAKPSPKRSQDAERRMYDDLMRACRIALTEAGGTATPQQVHSLIERRASFSFARLPHSAFDSVQQTLDIMYRAGELCLSARDPDSYSKSRSWGGSGQP